MAAMASAIHPDFRDDVTEDIAYAVDRKTRRLVSELHKADQAMDLLGYRHFAYEILRVRLRA
jgi:hypothetical protein